MSAAKKKPAAESEVHTDTYTFEVQRRLVERGGVVRTEWRLVMSEGGQVAVETAWKPRHRFFQDLLHHQQGKWAEWMLGGVGRPTA